MKAGINSSMTSYMPTRLLTGRDCVKNAGAYLKPLGKRCLVVTGRHSARACGALADVTAVLEEAGIDWCLFDGIGQNPLFVDCQAAAEKAVDWGAAFILGIGGGSPLDAAKCIAVLTANPGMGAEAFYAIAWNHAPLPVVAVGTTAGTGSEVTPIAVITSPEGRKKSARSDLLYPVLSLGDAKYTQTLSNEVTRSTAIDAFSHCVESYFGRTANQLSRDYAVCGLRLLLEVFRRTPVEGYGSLSAEEREDLYNASVYGGLAINLTGTALPHAMGYLLTEQRGIPHGIACAIYQPAFFDHNSRVMPELTAQFLQEIGCTREEYLQIVSAFIPEKKMAFTPEEIAREHHRWIHNATLSKVWGEITPEDADRILAGI